MLGPQRREIKLSDQDVSITGGCEQRSRELLGVRVREGFRKLDSKGPVEIS